MKSSILIAAMTLTLLTACASRDIPQKETKVVYETKYLKGAPVVHPDRPESIDMGDIKPTVTVITPGVIYNKYEAMLKKRNLDPELTAQLLLNLKAVTAMAEEESLFALIGTTKEDYFNLAKLNLLTIKWMRQANANFDYYESLDLRLMPEEESFGKTLNKMTEVDNESRATKD